jgi:hypothetical protein
MPAPPPARVRNLLILGLAAALLANGCTGDAPGPTPEEPGTIPQPTQAQLVAAGLENLPLAPESERVDIVAPTFSNPTEITNPLFPISTLRSAIFSGRVEGKPFHTETTLLPETRIIEIDEGRRVEARISQYTAYLDGRVEEVAIDYYAQADDGSVWYLGENVNDYDENGFVDSTLGSWLAGRDGPAQMIMPGDPRVGDVHRAENIPAIAFEEVTVKEVGRTVDGPTGPVEGALVERELHDDGTHSDKIFAPGYGEFFTGHLGEIEAMALAVPTDATDEPEPPELETMSATASALFDASQTGEWSSANESRAALTHAWNELRGGLLPPRLAKEMSRALRDLSAGIKARDRTASGTAAIDVAQSTLDLQLRYRPPGEIDLARFGLWTRQILVDAAADDLGGVRSDAVTMGWVRDRFAHTLDPASLTGLDAALVALGESTLDGDVPSAIRVTSRLRDSLAALLT